MTNLQILALCVFMLVAGISLYPIINVIKDKKITEEEKRLIQFTIIEVLKEGLKLYSIKNENEIKIYVRNKVYENLQVLNVDSITLDEVEIAVNLAFVNIDKLLEDK